MQPSDHGLVRNSPVRVVDLHDNWIRGRSVVDDASEGYLRKGASQWIDFKDFVRVPSQLIALGGIEAHHRSVGL